MFHIQFQHYCKEQATCYHPIEQVLVKKKSIKSSVVPQPPCQGTRYKVQDTYQSKPALQAETPVTCDTRILSSLQYHTNTPAKAAAHLKHQTKLISDGWISRLQTTWLRTVLARNSCGIYSSAHTVSMSTLIVR